MNVHLYTFVVYRVCSKTHVCWILLKSHWLVNLWYILVDPWQDP